MLLLSVSHNIIFIAVCVCVCVTEESLPGLFRFQACELSRRGRQKPYAWLI
jgi:hypothetical protein